MRMKDAHSANAKGDALEAQAIGTFQPCTEGCMPGMPKTETDMANIYHVIQCHITCVADSRPGNHTTLGDLFSLQGFRPVLDTCPRLPALRYLVPARRAPVWQRIHVSWVFLHLLIYPDQLIPGLQ